MPSHESATVIDTLLEGNQRFASESDISSLAMLPSRRTIIVGCVDPRVDPTVVLGAELGDALVIRNIGGRFSPNTLRTLALLAVIGRRKGAQPGDGWNLVVLQHTDCGIALLGDNLDALGAELGVAPDLVHPHDLTDPRDALRADLASVRGNPLLPRGLAVSGLLYDTETGRIEVVVPTFVLGHSPA